MQFRSLILVPIAYLKQLKWRFEIDDIGLIEACWEDVPSWKSLNEDKNLVSSFEFEFEKEMLLCVLNPRRSKVSVSTSHLKRDVLINFINKNKLDIEFSNLEKEAEYVKNRYLELEGLIAKLKMKVVK